MKTSTPGRISTLLKLTALFLASAALARGASAVESLGGNSYAISCEAKTTFNRDMPKLRAEAQEAAAKYCADHGKQLKIVTVVEDKPFYTLGFYKARVVFKALDAGDPELAAPGLAAAPAPGPAAAPTLPASGGDLYSELLKLDDLRKRGLLSDKEFEQQKKKLLKKY